MRMRFGRWLWRKWKPVGVSMLFLFILAPVAFAQTTGAVDQAGAVAAAAGLGGSDLMAIIGRIINVFLSVLGTVFLLLMLYAGFVWMMAQGDPKQVEKAKSLIKNALIGLAIIASAYAITAFILGLFAGILDGDRAGKGADGLCKDISCFSLTSGALGRGIEMHYPPRDAHDIARNTSIIITFKVPIDPASMIDGWTEALSGKKIGINAKNVRIHRTDSDASTSLATDKVRVSFTDDRRTFVLKPVDYLGSSTVPVDYTIDLMKEIKGMDGKAIFTSGISSAGYSWSFQVSTKVDLDPPYVVSAVPYAAETHPRNVVVQLTFNEAVDPTAVTGIAPKFTNIKVSAAPATGGTPKVVAGEYKISNQYQTVEFLSTAKCGTNSCGKDVFCLPATSTVEVVARAAEVDSKAPPQAVFFSSGGYRGVVDVAGNSMDGNHDLKAVGPDTDNYRWTFGTSDEVVLTPPKIESTLPSKMPSDGVGLVQNVTSTFNRLLQSSTLITDNAWITPSGHDETKPETFWWTTGMKLLNAAGQDVTLPGVTDKKPVKAALEIYHRPFLPSGIGLDKLNYYNPVITSDVQDVYQNCFAPARACPKAGGDGGDNCCDGKTSKAGCNSLFPTLKP